MGTGVSRKPTRQTGEGGGSNPSALPDNTGLMVARERGFPSGGQHIGGSNPTQSTMGDATE